MASPGATESEDSMEKETSEEMRLAAKVVDDIKELMDHSTPGSGKWVGHALEFIHAGEKYWELALRQRGLHPAQYGTNQWRGGA